ncbi:MAG: hypothetical protein ABJF88_13740 [Rhodothermales bacterium]
MIPLFLLLLSWTACDSAPDRDTFRVTLSDASGEAVYIGELELAIEPPGPADEPGEVTGRWQLDGVGGTPDPTPTSGAVVGSTAEGTINFVLDMDASDTGFLLWGRYEVDQMTGTWETITIAGPVPSGTFEAVRE